MVEQAEEPVVKEKIVVEPVQLDPKGQARLVKKAEGCPDLELKQFRVSHLVGKGGFGKVFLGKVDGDETQKRYAVKVIRKSRLAKNQEMIKTTLIEF